MDRPDIKIGAVTLDCAPHQVKAMVAFYSKLLGYTAHHVDGPFPYLEGDGVSITLQREEGYSPPDWPDGPAGQQAHIDLAVKSIPEAREYALSIGAVDSPAQFGDNWHIMLDPAGHPFCLCQDS